MKKNKIINWKKYVDHIYCIHYTPYSDRKERLEKELKRVGILDSDIFSWEYSYDMPKFASNASQDLAYNHLLCYYNALYMGYEKVLILEDDIVFLKDINMIQTLLDNLPNEYDLCLFDHIGYFNSIKLNIKDSSKEIIMDTYKYGQINDYYRYFTVSWLTSNYIIGTKMCNKVIEIIKDDISKRNYLEAPDHYLQNLIKYYFDNTITLDKYNNDPYLTVKETFKDCKTILSIPRMSIQSQYDNAVNIQLHHSNNIYNHNINSNKENEIIIPVKFEDYNIYQI